jgi:hypothetical protein
MKRDSITCLGALLLLLAACAGPPRVLPLPTAPTYAFFVAGHVYGHPYVNDVQVHPPFEEHADMLREHPLLAFGVFTGDIVFRSEPEEWKAVDEFVWSLGVPVHFALGNHDLTDPDLFEALYPDRPRHFAFTQGPDLFLVLDPNPGNWSLEQPQLDLVERQLAAHPDVRNVFVFFHQILWWRPLSIYRGFHSNSMAGRDPPINFWPDLVPLLRSVKRPVYVFGGDAGAFPSGHEFMYHQNGRLHFVASGMGGGKRDNFILVNVNGDGMVQLDLIALNGDDPGALGDLTDYILPEVALPPLPAPVPAPVPEAEPDADPEPAPNPDAPLDAPPLS